MSLNEDKSKQGDGACDPLYHQHHLLTKSTKIQLSSFFLLSPSLLLLFGTVYLEILKGLHREYFQFCEGQPFGIFKDFIVKNINFRLCLLPNTSWLISVNIFPLLQHKIPVFDCNKIHYQGTIAYHAHSASSSSSTGATHWYSYTSEFEFSTSLLETRLPCSKFQPRGPTLESLQKLGNAFLFLFEPSNFTKVNLNIVKQAWLVEFPPPEDLFCFPK